jgi:GTP-dependent phosphoenolpyruvate carboxykinase
MKKSSILKFTRKCLKAGYKEKVCRDTWMFGKPPTDETKKMYEECFKGEKVAVYPYSLKRRTLKHKKAPVKITKEMLLEATGPRFVPAKMVKGKWKPLA